MDSIEKELKENPWSLKDVIIKLCEATEILLYQKDYDGKGYEEMEMSLKIARDYIKDKNEFNR